MTIYITEHKRSLNSDAIIKRLVSVYAAVVDTPTYQGLSYKDYKPAEWQALLQQDDVLYRFRDEPFRKPY